MVHTDGSTDASGRPPGRRVDVGGYRLHIQCIGDGAPAVIFDTGLGGTSLMWARVLPQVGDFAHACAFDRAGYLWSDPGPNGVSRTSERIVAELRTLLQNAGIDGPYVLVGHSFGAINVLVYAYRYPDEVAGLVLVDPSHPEMFERIPEIPPASTVRTGFRVISFLGRLGLLRWFGPLMARRLFPSHEQMPADLWAQLVAVSKRPENYYAAMREAEVGEESFAQARGSAGSLGDLPLIVLSADWWVTGKQTALKTSTVPLREKLAGLSSQGEHVIVDDCDHADLPLARPDAVTAAVRNIVERIG